MHENLAKYIECEIAQDEWTKGAEISFDKKGYVLKFIKVQFDAGAVGDVDIKVENEQGRLLPYTTGDGDNFVRAVGSESLKFYIGVGLGRGDTFTIYYRNRATGNPHYANVFMEFVRKGGR